MSWNSIQLFGFIVVQYSIWGSKGLSGTFVWSGWNLMMYSLGYSTNFRCNEISDLLRINGRNEIYWASRCVKHDRKNWAFVPTVATILSWRCFTSCQDFLMPQKIMRILTTTEVLRSCVGCTLKVARASPAEWWFNKGSNKHWFSLRQEKEEGSGINTNWNVPLLLHCCPSTKTEIHQKHPKALVEFDNQCGDIYRMTGGHWCCRSHTV